MLNLPTFPNCGASCHENRGRKARSNENGASAAADWFGGADPSGSAFASVGVPDADARRAARLAGGICRLELHSDRQHDAAPDPPPDRRRMGTSRRIGSAPGSGDDTTRRACAAACSARPSEVYPWATDPATIPADVARWYLNEVSFLIRTSIALAGWSLLAVIFAAGLGSRLLAGLGLTFFGLTISLIAVDWYLSLEPRYVATAFAAMIAVQQLLAALAFAALIGGPVISGKVAGDLGGLLIATLLGVAYLELMTFVVAWYGDLPDKSAWFLKRAGSGWIAVLVIAILFGAVLPFGMLLIKAIRDSRRGLRMAGVLILFGTTLHIAWLLVPAFDAQAGVITIACAALAILVLVSLLIGSALRPVLEASHAE